MGIALEGRFDMDEITRLEIELDAVLRELLEKDPNAVLRVLLTLQQASLPVVWPKINLAG